MRHRVFIADDSDYVLKILNKVISTWNDKYEIVAEAGDGIEALDIIEEVNFDICLLDIVMPFADGFEVLEKIKDKNPKAKVIIMTASNKKENIDRAKQLGANDFLSKPFNKTDLEEILNRVITS